MWEGAFFKDTTPKWQKYKLRSSPKLLSLEKLGENHLPFYHRNDHCHGELLPLEAAHISLRPPDSHIFGLICLVKSPKMAYSLFIRDIEPSK